MSETDNLMDRQRSHLARELIAKIEECERECHQIRFTRAAHAINAAKNAIGWDYAEFMESLKKPTPGAS